MRTPKSFTMTTWWQQGCGESYDIPCRYRSSHSRERSKGQCFLRQQRRHPCLFRLNRLSVKNLFMIRSIEIHFHSVEIAGSGIDYFSRRRQIKHQNSIHIRQCIFESCGLTRTISGLFTSVSVYTGTRGHTIAHDFPSTSIRWWELPWHCGTTGGWVVGRRRFGEREI